jgi:pyridoxine 5-phosphate synthase
MFTRLSVNINKVATIRNARGGNNPNLIQVAMDCERFGAQGITVHPRPDERHIKYADVYDLKKIVQTEFNIEGNPEAKFIYLVDEVKPHQVTLVPDKPDAITSNAGWDTITYFEELKEVVTHFKKSNIRVSVFVDPRIEMVEGAAKAGADRVELYTEPYAHDFTMNKENSIISYYNAAKHAHDLGMGVNAGHDLSLQNLNYFIKNIPFIDEVSIGHALICDALYFGLENTIQQYLRQLK